jgi:glycosyltransferase involved in cell wall biosynthesis
VKFVLASGLINFAAFITDIFSTEVKEGIDKISSFHPQIGKKLVYIPNGIDAGLAGKIFAEVKKADKKENIIITAGRIGTKQKNSLMLLKALELLDLRDWKVFFVGSVEDDFCGTIADFFEKNPYLRDRVIFKGMLEKKEELYSIYNRAKVFVLTSEFEGFPLVFPEALHFGNLIVTTRIGPADDITDSGRIGFVIGQNDHEALAKKLFEIIKDPGIYASKYDSIIEYSKNFTWDNIASMLYNAVKNTGRSFTDPG